MEYTLKYSRPLYDDLGIKQDLCPLFGGENITLDQWTKERLELKNKWEELIGRPSFDGFTESIETVKEIITPDFKGTLCKQATSPDTKQLVLIMEPVRFEDKLRPGAIIPFYQPDAMAGYDLNTGEPILKAEVIQFGLHLVRQGYVVICTQAFPFNTVPEPVANEGFAWWQAAADKILSENPEWTGIGKLIWDTRLAIDLLSNLDNIDKERIVIMGHSLGGKMAFCTAAFDERIKAVIASDFGIGWDSTNWQDDWYYGSRINREGFDLANHQLLALIAPRPFLLIGGQYDGPVSWQYILEAKKVYKLYQKEDLAGFLDHASGHRPPMYAVDEAYRWLSEQFRLPFRKWIS